MLTCHIVDRIHVGTLTKQVDGNNSFGCRCDSRFDESWVQVKGIGFDINKNRLGAQTPDGTGGSKEREAGHDDFIPCLHIEGHQGEQQRVTARTASDGMLGIANPGHRRFQLDRSGPQHKCS